MKAALGRAQERIIQHAELSYKNSLLVIDDDLRNVGPSVETIIKEVEAIYQHKSGPDVKITVKEVKEIKPEKGSSKPSPIVVSHIKIGEGYKILENA